MGQKKIQHKANVKSHEVYCGAGVTPAIAFFGTPSFAAVSLQALIGSGRNVVCVVTQPDKPVGRGGRVEYPPVKKLALENNIPVLQPDKISKELELLDQYKPDIIVTCAFGQILRQNVLDYCKHGVINVHASLLPKYRGASPIQQAIINGETKTGVTIMQTDIGMDTGDIILAKEIDIHEDETAGELFERLSVLGASTLLEALELISSGRAVRTPQNHSKATHIPMIKKEHGKIDFSKSAKDIQNHVRGMNPWPVAFCTLNDELVRIYKAIQVICVSNDPEKSVVCKENGVVCETNNPGDKQKQVVGQIIKADKNGLYVQCGEGILSIEQLQASGGKVMNFRDFLNGKKIQVGDVFQ